VVEIPQKILWGDEVEKFPVAGTFLCRRLAISNPLSSPFVISSRFFCESSALLSQRGSAMSRPFLPVTAFSLPLSPGILRHHRRFVPKQQGLLPIM